MKTERRILIIEDNVDDEALLLRQLTKAGLGKHIKVIHDGGEALDFLTDEGANAESLSAIFLDLKLPHVSGLQLLEIVRSDNRLRDIPVIVMTSSNAEEDLETCRELGVCSFVQKPLTFTSFAKAFADCFHARRLMAEAAEASAQTVE